MAINWTNQGNQLHSDCGRFKIENRGKKGGKLYVLYEYSNEYKAYCLVRRIGTYKQVKERAEQ